MNRTGQGPEDLPVMTDDSADGLADLVKLWSTAAQAYMNGNLGTYAGLARHGADYTLMPPNGGNPRRGFDDLGPATN